MNLLLLGVCDHIMTKIFRKQYHSNEPPLAQAYDLKREYKLKLSQLGVLWALEWRIPRLARSTCRCGAGASLRLC